MGNHHSDHHAKVKIPIIFLRIDDSNGCFQGHCPRVEFLLYYFMLFFAKKKCLYKRTENVFLFNVYYYAFVLPGEFVPVLWSWN